MILRRDDPFAQVVVPDHRELDRGTLRAIIRQADLSVDEFTRLLWGGVAWRQIEIMPDDRGKPLVYLYGRAAERAAELGLTTFAVSLTHTDDLALAFVVAT